MMEYALNGKRISLDDIEVVNIFPGDETEPLFGGSEKHFGIWEAEQNLWRMIREGSPQYK